jgi:hypothetical protein
MQCRMCCQCGDLFSCIINYLYVLCMTLMMCIYVLYMFIIIFIYIYYGVFACTNLVDIILLFFTVFSIIIFLDNPAGF